MEDAVLIFHIWEKMDVHLCNPEDVTNAMGFFSKVGVPYILESTFLYAECALSMNIGEQTFWTSIYPTY